MTRLVTPIRLRAHLGNSTRKVSWLELFFDLIFVAAVAQVAEPLREHYSLSGVLRFATLFALIWWAWTGYAVFATRFDADDGVQRLLSTFDDYFSWFVTLLPLVTGMALLERPYNPAPVVVPELPASPTMLALHLLSLEVLLVWLPFGKLAHAALFAFSRWRTGADFTRKGAAP